jgi:Dynein heavy chain, N-terminal region 2
MTQAMAFLPFKKPFEERIAKWDATLRLVSDTLDAWLAVQRSWMYLEPIFSSPDIMEQLPLEGKRFVAVDRTWRKALAAAAKAPCVLAVCSSQKLLDSFVDAGQLLDSVQKGLANYLETKRLAFARCAPVLCAWRRLQALLPAALLPLGHQARAPHTQMPLHSAISGMTCTLMYCSNGSTRSHQPHRLPYIASCNTQHSAASRGHHAQACVSGATMHSLN